MNLEQRKRLLDAINELTAAEGISFDDFLEALAAEMKDQAREQSDANVRSCLMSCAESLSRAGLDFYVSTK